MAVWLRTLPEVGPLRDLAIERQDASMSHRVCTGRIEADHMGRRGIGQKAEDSTCAPMCTKHHRHRTDVYGFFKGWTQAELRLWVEWAIGNAREQVSGMRAKVQAHG